MSFRYQWTPWKLFFVADGSGWVSGGYTAKRTWNRKNGALKMESEQSIGIPVVSGCVRLFE